ncbi:MAG TPA: ABC transporter permease [Cyclobacteriaceae bacterium]|nr:ABC transporter permease [Cyclobacteriaceae bacterium]
MLRSFFTITLRNILRDKYFSLINVVGLAIGLASCLLIFSYVKQQLSYDQDHPDVDRTYRVNQTAIWNPQGGKMGSTSLPLAQTLINDYPEIEDALRINMLYGQIMRYDDGKEIRAFYEDQIIGADSNFFSFFSFPLREGDPKKALKNVNSVVLSPEAARKFFGDKSPLGRTLLLGDDRIPVEVTGVTDDQPENIHFHFDYLISINTNPLIKEFEWSWIWTQVVTYIKLKPGQDPTTLEEKFKSLASRHVAPTFARFDINYEDFIREKDGWNFYLQPVQRIHLYSQEEGNRLGPVSDIKYVYIFSAVGLFVVLLAIINFINLTTARAANRAKEVGVKKVLGARRQSMVLQFQFESITLAFCAMIIGLGLMELLRIGISSLLGVQIPFLSVWQNDLFWLLPLMTLAVGIIAGAYPSFYLTALQPAAVLKGKLFKGFKRSGLRNTLTVVQFVVSIGFIASTIIVYQQLNYFKNSDLGFDQENVLVINHAEKLGTHLEAFRNQVAGVAGVKVASVAMDVPGRGGLEDIFTKEGSDEKFPVSMMQMDEYFMDALSMSLVAGEGYKKDVASDLDKVLINETTARLFGWTPEEAIGKKIIYMGDEMGAKEVKGVLRDFHFESLKSNIAPVVFYHVNTPTWNNNRVMALKISTTSVNRLLINLKAAWSEIVHDAPFEYSFLKEEWINKYDEEERLGGLFTLFTCLSITIAMIGMIGLVTYSAEQRKKEIGVRKVLGATVGQMVVLLNGNFTRLIVISLVLAVPVSWYAMYKWLEQFPYKISINATVYVTAGIVILLITWLTVSYQSIKAALTNPSEVLKEE